MLSNVYLEAIKGLSDRIVEAQRPIRVLDAIKWDDEVRDAFFKSKFKKLPPVDVDYYAGRPLSFDPEEKRHEFHEVERDIVRHLGQMNPLTKVMRRICREYQTVVHMLEARGKRGFADLSQELYGSSEDVFHAGDPTVADLGTMMEETIMPLLKNRAMRAAKRKIPAAEAVEILNARLTEAFPDAGIRVILSDGIVADAAAGTDYIKLREDAMFNDEDIDALEVHEGWVHLGTSLNGAAQPYCTFLGKGPPSSTITQEGLAVLTEVLSLRSTPDRLAKLIRRVRAATLAEQGADFIEVFNYLLEQDMEADDAWVIAARAFRGSTPTGRPFTKDIAYLKGFVLTYNFVSLAVAADCLDRVPFLFCGKVVLEDVRLLHDLAEEGVVVPPKYMPPILRDTKGLVAWLSFNRFLSQLSFEKLQTDYAPLL